MVEVPVEQLERDGLERLGHGRHLREHVDAVGVLFHHALQTPHLPLDAAQALEDRIALVAVARLVPALLFHTPSGYRPSQVAPGTARALAAAAPSGPGGSGRGGPA